MRTFVGEGCSVGMFARSGGYLDDLAADLAVESEVRAGFEAVRRAFGLADVLVNHASAGSWKGLLELTVEEF